MGPAYRCLGRLGIRFTSRRPTGVFASGFPTPAAHACTPADRTAFFHDLIRQTDGSHLVNVAVAERASGTRPRPSVSTSVRRLRLLVFVPASQPSSPPASVALTL